MEELKEAILKDIKFNNIDNTELEKNFNLLNTELEKALKEKAVKEV